MKLPEAQKALFECSSVDSCTRGEEGWREGQIATVGRQDQLAARRNAVPTFARSSSRTTFWIPLMASLLHPLIMPFPLKQVIGPGFIHNQSSG
jgi:hypothetical protein